MISQKSLDALKGIGLNLYERKLYAALLSRGTSTAGELSEMSSVPRSRSYDVLESLADKGFVIVQNAKPLRYVAIAPNEALSRATKRLHEKLDENVQRFEEFKNSPALSELVSLHTDGVSLVSSADLSGAMKGRYAMHQQIETMFKSAEKSLDILTTEEGLNQLHTSHAGLLQSAADKGLSIRIAAPITQKNSEAAEALGVVAEVKHLKSSAVSSLPTGRMVLADDKEVVLALTDDATTHSTQEVSFWTASDHFGTAFAKPTFDMIWNHLD